jgi:hypothetical protein
MPATPLKIRYRIHSNTKLSGVSLALEVWVGLVFSRSVNGKSPFLTGKQKNRDEMIGWTARARTCQGPCLQQAARVPRYPVTSPSKTAF